MAADGDPVLDALRELGGLGVPPLDPVGLRRRVRGALEAPARARRPRLGGVLLAAGAAAALVVALVAGLALHGRSGPPSTPGRSSADAGLLARLGVLRRPQNASDRLPAGLRIADRQGRIIPGLTRLAVTDGTTRLYLVVSTPPTGYSALWSPRLGDQVAILALIGRRGEETEPVPAAGLDDADAVSVLDPAFVAGRSRPGAPGFARQRAEALVVGIVPDGVDRVQWRFALADGRPGPAVTPWPGSNVALLPPAAMRGRAAFVDGARWYGAAGQPIRTSSAPLRAAETARQDRMRAQSVRVYARYHYVPPRALLAEFPIFRITSRTPVRVAGGLRVSAPALATLPFTIVNFADPRQPARLDPNDIRQVSAPDGLTMWVIPGANGLCVTALDPPWPGSRGVSGGGESCSGSLTLAERDGAGMSDGAAPGGRATVDEIHPAGATVRVGGRLVHPSYGIVMHR